MPEDMLIPEPFLGGYSAEFGATRLAEVTGLGLVSIAVPIEGRDQLATRVAAAWDVDLPGIGRTAAAGEVRLLGLARDQFLAVLPLRGPLATTEVAAALGDAGYITEQTDNWVILELDGPLAVAALERICPLDLDEARFPQGGVARTVTEHLGAIILREARDRFLLLSASSSAGSFRDAVETSVRNVC